MESLVEGRQKKVWLKRDASILEGIVKPSIFKILGECAVLATRDYEQLDSQGKTNKGFHINLLFY